MRSRKLDQSPQTYVVVLDSGDSALDEILGFAAQVDMATASFTAIGAFQEATLAFFDIHESRYLQIPVHEQVEVLTMAGDIVGAGADRQVHAHVVVGRRDGTTRGGHLMNATVRPTLEIMITESDEDLSRRYDTEVGLPLIDLDART